MNLFRRIVLVLSSLSVAAMAAYPPWDYEIPEVKAGDVTYPSCYRFAGYAAICDAPEMKDWVDFPERKPTPGEASETVGGGGFAGLSLNSKHEEFIAEQDRRNTRTAHLDLPRLCIQVFGVLSVDGALLLFSWPKGNREN